MAGALQALARRPGLADGGFFKHETAIVETSSVGAGTRIWAYAHVLPGAVIGAYCNICDQTFIENDVHIGDRVTIKCGVQVWDGITLEDDVFVGPNATFSNDPFPRSRHHPDRYARTLVKRGASIGANATILPGLTIGRKGDGGRGRRGHQQRPAAGDCGWQSRPHRGLRWRGFGLRERGFRRSRPKSAPPHPAWPA